MKNTLSRLKQKLPDVEFSEGPTFSWSPANSTVNYRLGEDMGSILSLLHEASHALLCHESYQYDLELLIMEVEAWQKAQELAKEFELKVDENHIQDRLDSYRDWLHQRSTCPRCGTVSTQNAPKSYSCHNCNAGWKVSSSRFCRPYRLSKYSNKKTSGGVKPRTSFV